MYLATLALLLLAGGLVGYRGLRRGNRLQAAAGIGLALVTVAFFSFLDLWGEALWFSSLGYSRRFWIEVGARVVNSLAGILLGALAAALVAAPPFRLTVALGALWGLAWGSGSWEQLLLWWYGQPAGVKEPILGRDAGFYLFALPFYDQVILLLLAVAITSLVVGAATTLVSGLGSGRIRLAEARTGIDLPTVRRSGAPRALALLALALAAGRSLATFHLLYSEAGAVTGPGWTDVHVRLPALLMVAVVLLLLGAAPVLPAAHRWLARRVPQRWSLPPAVGALLLPWLAIAGLWAVALGVLPSLLQWLRVEPNEISFEKPYIAHNIELTRHAFGLDALQEREFPATGDFTRETVDANRDLVSEIRLWDWRALDSVYQQFQEIRLYYEFADVDIDRYRIADRYRQVMVSAREMEPDNLPPQSQTFINRRFKYTHGYGITLAPVSDFTEEGLPHLLVRDIPPQSALEELAVERPEIYYGELTTQPVYAASREEEFDFPRGDENVYVRYQGKGGVRLGGLWRKVVFGWKLGDGTRFLLSSYPAADTRVMFHRQIRERVAALAPFLELDADPYVVLSGGRLYWIVDGYTTSRYFPYSTRFSSSEEIELAEGDQGRRLFSRVIPYLDGANYVRNAVKAVVSAYDGSVELYVFDPDDPVIRTWERIYPGLLRPASEMPPELRAHVRYPVDLLLVQGLVYARYHMTDPAVFYNQEDLWVRATEKYYGDVQPVEPYYVMWQEPGSDRAQLILMLPFTPKNRQVLIGWIAGMCDPPRYGEFLAYKFPKERRLLGPQQVETKIDQDRHLSGQLTLWDQRGSQVIRGNVLAIPIDKTLIYVEPIYLKAETAAYPELRLVAIMHGDRLAYGQSFQEALEKLLGGEAETPGLAEGEAAPGGASRQGLIERAAAALERYRRLQGAGRFAEAGEELEHLQAALEALLGEGGD